jgi:Ca2+-binding RTX toxin-like protein
MATGDGRGNENIALTTVHSIFHSEHNRLVGVNKATILQSNDLAFLNEWLLVDVTSLPVIPPNATPAQLEAIASTLTWDGDRIFQAARFGTEMQYQHMVFEEFARRIQPMVDPFIFNTTPSVNPSVVAEFAHTVYRFGHSMLTGTVDRLENDLTAIDEGILTNPDQKTLLAVFLNPQQYLDSGANLDEINANIIRGLSRDVGNAMDEFIVTNVRSQLLGLPLDLAVLNLARGRETGIPSLNETRRQLYEDTGFSDLKPYTSWQDFALNIKHAASIINFIAAYGTHDTITSAVTLDDKRAAAEAIVFGGTGAPADRVAFLTGSDAYAGGAAAGAVGTRGGLNLVDLWIGGLAEKNPEFGGMLGTTFNYVFEFQMESLQFGDRFYYLTRTQGTNFLNNLEPNTFADIVMRNTDLGDQYSTHLYGQLFVTPDHIIELDRGIAQEDYNGAAPGSDPVWDGSNPIMEGILGPKVVRGYLAGDVPGYAGNGDMTANGHDEGGYLRVIGGEHYVLGGTEGADVIYGDSGMDTIWGDGGNDYINGGTEADDVFGGAGDDVIEDPFGEGDVLRGNDGNDVITAAGGADLLFGNAGQDYIALGADAAEVFGGEGTDFILGGAGKDFLLGNEGSDWIEGGSGFDTIAGENSELFFNSPIIGHDVLFGQGDETDYDSESGDDIMASGTSVFRYEGMHGFDWGIAKGDLHSGVHFDLFIPVFTTVPEDILRDRFDSVEGLSGWKYSDILDGDDRGHKGGGSSAPDSTPVVLFTNDVLTQEGIDRINGMEAWMGDAIGVGANAGVRQTLFNFASVGGAQQTSYRDGNILLGGDGNDFLRGRGGYDVLDGDAYLNVRIKIVIPSGPNAGTYSAESLNTDTSVSGEYAGKVYKVYTAADQAADPTHIAGSPNFASVAFGGASLTSLMLNRTINPGDMSIVREILYDNTNVTGTGMNIDSAIFQGTLAEYEIEGRVTDGINNTGQVISQARDLNGDGFIFVRDKDTGATGATITGPDGLPLTLTSSRGALTDDFDLLKNIEQLVFADATIQIGGPNRLATATVTIADPTPYLGLVTPYVGQVLVPTLSGLNDLDGVPIDPATGMPVGLTFEWQTTETGGNAGWSLITTGLTYTVRSVDPGHILRAVAVFKDANGVTERIYSVPTSAPTAASSVNENSLTDTVVLASIPFNPDYDPDSTLGGVTDGDIVALTHYIAPGQDAGGRFKVVQQGTDLNGVPIFKVMVANGGPLLDYEIQDAFQIVDNQYQIVINSYTDSIENGGLLLATRQFTIMLNDVVDEAAPVVYAPTDINWNGIRPVSETALPLTGVTIANLTTVDIDSSPVTFSKVGGDAGIVVTGAGAVSRTGGLAANSTYLLNVRAQESSGAFVTEAINIRTGTTGGNIITGSALTDVMYGLGGNDTLNGAGGNDTLFGQDGSDTLNGGSGNDDLTGGDDDDIINGEAGNDTIRLTIDNNDDDNDDVDGGADTDTLVINGRADLTVVSNEQLDVVFDGTSITEIEGGGSIVNVESVTANLGAGTGDTLDYDDTTADVTVNLTAGTASGFTSIVGIENVMGDAGNDTLIGLAGQANLLTGGAGNDTFTVHDLTDTIHEANNGGTDTVLFSSAVNGQTYTLTDLDNGGGDGTADVENLTLLGSANLNGTGNAVANVITGNSGNNTLLGLDGDDTLIGGLGNDTLNGGNQIDTASYAGATTGVIVSLAVVGAQDLDGGGVLTEQDTLLNIENLTGSAQGDTLTGNISANVLSGSGGNDTLNATVDNVRDTLDGGANTDTANYAAYAAALTVNLGGAAPIVVTGSGSNAANSDVLVAIENFVGGSGVNTLTGDGNANALTGGGVNDILNGAGGNDVLNGLGGADTISGGAGADTIDGGAGNDTIIVDIDGDPNEADAIQGGADSDTLSITDTGTGNETLTVAYNGTSITQIEGAGSIAGIEAVTANLGAGTGDTLAYTSTSAVTVNLAAGAASGFSAISNIENVTGGTGNDTITGNASANELSGGTGADTIFGAGGNDNLDGNDGNDFIDGGEGADDLNGGNNDDTYVGGGGNDTIDVGSGNDVIRYNAAGFGADVINNFDANATGGQDLIDVSGLGLTVADVGATAAFRVQIQEVEDGGTDDTLITIRDAGGAVMGTILLNEIDNAPTVNVSASDFIFTTSSPPVGGATNGNNTLNGTAGNDTVTGLQGNDTISTLAGDDTIIWNANPADPTDGMDIVNGGIEGTAGDTFVLNGRAAVAETFRIYTAAAWGGVAGNNIASLAVGTEIVITRNGTNLASVIAQLSEIEEIRVNGFDPAATSTLGGDSIEIIGNFSGTSLRPNTITIDGDAGNDTVDISALSSAHRIVFKSNGGNDTIVGALRPDDVIELPNGGTLADYVETTVNGVTTLTKGSESITFTASAGMPQVNPGPVVPPPAGDSAIILPSIGTPGNDVLNGNALDNYLIGFSGDDVIIGFGGKDVLLGDAGNDFLASGSGEDSVFGGAGADTIVAGEDADLVYGDEDDDRIFTDAGNDMVTGGAGNDTVVGGAGNDMFVAGIGDGNDAYFGDEVTGGVGIDTLNMSAITANTSVNLGTGLGGLGSAVSVQSGSDTLWGVENVVTGSGADTITASDAVNVMDGGTGNDTFVFKTVAAANGDTIVGFETGDKIDLSNIDANQSMAGNQSFTLVSPAITSVQQLSVRHETRADGDYTVIEGNVNDANAPDFKVSIQGTHNLAASDFTL